MVKSFPPADCRSTDVIFLCDSSKEVSTKDFSTVKDLLSDIYDMIGIQPQKTRVGVALFGKLYQEKINLDDSLTKKEWKAEIQALPHLGTDFNILPPLLKVIFMFSKENGGRREAGIPQNLVVITSQPPDRDVSKAVEKLKEQNIRILVISIGIHSKDQFLPLTGNPDYIISLKNFQQLNSALNKKRIAREICQQDQPSSKCSPAQVFLNRAISLPLGLCRQSSRKPKCICARVDLSSGKLGLSQPPSETKKVGRVSLVVIHLFVLLLYLHLLFLPSEL